MPIARRRKSTRSGARGLTPSMPYPLPSGRRGAVIPPGANGIVVFVHGSSRHSPRNQFVARVIRESGNALLFDLLTADEEIEDNARRSAFEIDLLANRLVEGAMAVAQTAPRELVSTIADRAPAVARRWWLPPS
jgi:hypothetical protein